MSGSCGCDRQGVAEKDQGVDLSGRHLGADLDVTPPGAGQHRPDAEAGRVAERLAGRGRGQELPVLEVSRCRWTKATSAVFRASWATRATRQRRGLQSSVSIVLVSSRMGSFVFIRGGV